MFSAEVLLRIFRCIHPRAERGAVTKLMRSKLNKVSKSNHRRLARQLAQAMDASGCRDVMEFGAGSGALAAQLIAELDALGAGLARYRIVELSAELRERPEADLSECRRLRALLDLHRQSMRQFGAT